MNVENNLDKKAQLKIIADFRNATGYSLSDCKSVLEKTNFDMNAAKDILSKKYAEKYKMLADSSDIEGNGFNRVSSNEGFKSMYDDILGYYREPIKFEKLKKKHLTKGEVFANYPHTVYHKQEGKKAYTVSKSSAPLVLKYEGELNDEGIEQIRKLAYAISMTIIGSNKAKVFSKEELDPKMIEEFKNAKTEEAKKLGKPEAAIEKIVSGQLNKFYAENLIVHLPLISTANTPWLKVGDDGDVTVEDAIKQTEKLLNCKISVSFYKVLTDK